MFERLFLVCSGAILIGTTRSKRTCLLLLRDDVTNCVLSAQLSMIELPEGELHLEWIDGIERCEERENNTERGRTSKAVSTPIWCSTTSAPCFSSSSVIRRPIVNFIPYGYTKAMYGSCLNTFHAVFNTLLHYTIIRILILSRLQFSPLPVVSRKALIRLVGSVLYRLKSFLEN